MENNEIIIHETLKDLKEIEKTIDEQLKILEEKIDAGYGQMASTAEKIAKIAIGGESGRKYGKIVSMGINAIGEMRKAEKHNEYLDRLMEMKMAIATEKAGTIKRIMPKIDKNIRRMTKVMKNECGKEYDVQGIADMSDEGRMSLRKMQRQTADIMRKTLWAKEVAVYLEDSYEAWMRGQQEPKTDRPTLETVNRMMLEMAIPSDEERGEFMNEMSKKRTKISGGLLMAMTDAGMTATGLINGGYKDDSDSDDIAVIDVEMAKRLGINDNEVINKTLDSYKSIVVTAIIGKVLKYSIYIAVFSMLFYWFWNKDWGWWKWILFLIADVPVYYILTFITAGIENRFNGKVVETYDNNTEMIKAKAGHEEKTTDTEKKSVAEAAIDGFFRTDSGYEIPRSRMIKYGLDESFFNGLKWTKWLDVADPILGFIIPGVGDTIMTVFTLPFIWTSLVKIKSIPLTLTVVFYILKDYLIGLIPIIGDIADIFYTSNTYILRTIEGYVAGDKETVHKVNSSAVKCAIGIVVLGIAIYYAIQLVAYILSAIFG